MHDTPSPPSHTFFYFSGGKTCFLPIPVNSFDSPNMQLHTLTLYSSLLSSSSVFCLSPSALDESSFPSLSMIYPALLLFLSHLPHLKLHFDKRKLPDQVLPIKIKQQLLSGYFMAEQLNKNIKTPKVVFVWNFTSLLQPTVIYIGLIMCSFHSLLIHLTSVGYPTLD